MPNNTLIFLYQMLNASKKICKTVLIRDLTVSGSGLTNQKSKMYRNNNVLMLASIILWCY